MSTEETIRGLGLSRRIFRLFLVFFPSRFRKTYAKDILELFRDRYREEYRRAGVKGAIFYLARSIGEALVHGLQERWQQRAGRTRSAVPAKKMKKRI